MDKDNIKGASYKTLKTVGKWIMFFLIGLGVVFGGKYAFEDYMEKHDAEVRRKVIDEFTDKEDEVIVTPEIKVDVNTLMSAIAPAAELVTTNYYYASADVFEKDTQFFNIPIPFTKDKTVFMYNGEIKLGIKDIKDISFEINDDNKTIVVNMPKNKIISHEIDDNMQTIVVANSIVTEMDLDEYNELRNVLEEKEETKLNMKIEYWEHIQKNSEDVIRSFITPFANDYEITFKWKEDE